MNKIRMAAVLAGLLFSAGCALAPIRQYEGPAKPDKEVALLTGGGAYFGSKIIWLQKIDGEYGPYEGHFTFNDTRQPDPVFHLRHNKFKVQLMPGRHTLEVGGTKHPHLGISFDAEAGKKYTLKKDKRTGLLDVYENANKVNTAEAENLDYQEPAQGEPAVLAGPGVFEWQPPKTAKLNVTLYKIDGKYLPFGKDLHDSHLPVKLSPGEHTLEYSCSVGDRFDFHAQKILIQKVTVEAGKKYSFKGTGAKAEKTSTDPLFGPGVSDMKVWVEEVK